MFNLAEVADVVNVSVRQAAGLVRQVDRCYVFLPPGLSARLTKKSARNLLAQLREQGQKRVVVFHNVFEECRYSTLTIFPWHLADSLPPMSPTPAQAVA